MSAGYHVDICRMKAHLLSALLILSTLQVSAQARFSVSIEEVNFPTSVGVHSFVVGQHDGKWLIFGGRKDGLHRRQPNSSFLAADNNVNAYVIDPVSLQVWSASLANLPTVLFEQVQSTNMEFAQRDTVVYFMGGYGRSNAQNDHVTHALLSAVNVPGAMAAVISGSDLTPHFRYLSDNRMAVTGGYLHLLNGTFYQVGGQYFEGRYNPMGPNHGPGFIQQYKEAIQKFSIVDNGVSLIISDYSETVDAANLHRRDYNLVPQVFPNGAAGFTAFTGVFQQTQDLPWLNTVDILADSYAVNNTFNQLLNQYHTAHLPVFDEVDNSMHTVFFGGIGQYYYDSQSGSIIEDQAVPFVKTISVVTRLSDGSMSETALDIAMPDYLGSGAEFIPLKDLPFLQSEILDLAELPVGQSTLVGHIFGGIQSSARNIFFINDGTQSHASNRLFKVFIQVNPTTVDNGTVITGKEVFKISTFPNPVEGNLTVELSSPFATSGRLSLISINGSTVLEQAVSLEASRMKQQTMDCSALPVGNYLVRFDNGSYSKDSTVIIKK
jgi:hypothetical protein